MLQPVMSHEPYNSMLSLLSTRLKKIFEKKKSTLFIEQPISENSCCFLLCLIVTKNSEYEFYIYGEKQSALSCYRFYLITDENDQ